MSDSEPDDLRTRVFKASMNVTNSQGMLMSAIRKVGMVASPHVGADPHIELLIAIEQYARAVARHEMLAILSTEDFFLAITHSAGAQNPDP